MENLIIVLFVIMVVVDSLAGYFLFRFLKPLARRFSQLIDESNRTRNDLYDIKRTLGDMVRSDVRMESLNREVEHQKSRVSFLERERSEVSIYIGKLRSEIEETRTLLKDNNIVLIHRDEIKY